MYKEFIKYFPSRLFCLANILFWLVLNTLAADHTHRTMLRFERESNWLSIWFQYLPYWANYALLAPVIIAMVRMIGVDGQRWWILVTKNLLLMLVGMSVYWGLTLVEVTLINNHGAFNTEAFSISFSHLLASPMHMDFLIYLTIASFAIALSFHARSKEQAVHNQKLSNQLLTVELQALKAQLNPHFLFNTLNTISGLVRLENKPDAVKALSELSLMFRKVLENQHNQMTSLKNEMEFINSYLTIQKMRFENKLSFKMDIEENCLDAELPFMLLHTLVENAVQHGSQLESNENILKLHICMNENKLEIHLINKASTGEHKGFGIGLNNCRKRLGHLYHNDYELQCKEIGDGYFETSLLLPVGDANA
jgi:two-component system, LytTR family, sensor kinase